MLVLLGRHTEGVTLMIAGTSSMTLAALVLFTGSPDKRAAALKQFAFPAVSLALLLISTAV